MINHLPVFRIRIADTDTDTVIIRRNMGIYAFQAVMPAGSAAELGLNLPDFKIQIIMNDNNVFRQNFIKQSRLNDRIPRQIHKSLRFQQHDFLAVNIPFGNQTVKLTFKRAETKTLRHRVCGHKSDIMTGIGIFSPGIPQTDN